MFIFRFFKRTNSSIIASQSKEFNISFSIDINANAFNFSSVILFRRTLFISLSFEKDRSSTTLVTNNDKKIRRIMSRLGKTPCNLSFTIWEYMEARETGSADALLKKWYFAISHSDINSYFYQCHFYRMKRFFRKPLRFHPNLIRSTLPGNWKVRPILHRNSFSNSNSRLKNQGLARKFYDGNLVSVLRIGTHVVG